VRLFCYNMHKGIGGRDRRYRMQRIIDVIESQNPDLVCLQEVARGTRRSRFDDQPRVLTEYFRPESSHFQTNVRYRYGGYGNLIFSRWPVLEHHDISLRFADRKPRGAQLVVVESHEGPVHIANTHLGLSDRERQWQIARLVQHRLFERSGHLPTLIAGDLNDWRNSLAPRILKQHDFYLVTHPASRFRTFPAWMPVGALDKVFLRGAIRIRRAKVIRTARTRRASDHLPVVVDFHLIDT